MAIFWQIHQDTFGKPADDVSILGQPSLPAANVDAIFARLGSPMVGTGKVVEQASAQTGIDDAFALGVWWTETNDGAAGVGRADLNPGSVRSSRGFPAAYDGYTIYPSYTVAIQEWFKLIKDGYVARGITTIYALANPYVGTSSAPLWAGKVTALTLHYRGEAPTPTPVPARQALSKIKELQRVAKVKAQSVKTGTLPVLSTSAGGTSMTLANLIFVFFGLLLAASIAYAGIVIERRALALQKKAIPSVPTTPHVEYDLIGTSRPTELSPVRLVQPVPIMRQQVPETPTVQPVPIKQQVSETPIWNLPTHVLNENRPIRRVVLLPSRGNNPSGDNAYDNAKGLMQRYAERTRE